MGALSLLLASEAALSLPDETAEAVHMADFYHDHVVAILLLQIAGLGTSVLLGAYMWRLRSVDRVVGGTGVALASPRSSRGRSRRSWRSLPTRPPRRRRGPPEPVAATP